MVVQGALTCRLRKTVSNCILHLGGTRIAYCDFPALSSTPPSTSSPFPPPHRQLVIDPRYACTQASMMVQYLGNGVAAQAASDTEILLGIAIEYVECDRVDEGVTAYAHVCTVGWGGPLVELVNGRCREEVATRGGVPNRLCCKYKRSVQDMSWEMPTLMIGATHYEARRCNVDTANPNFGPERSLSDQLPCVLAKTSYLCTTSSTMNVATNDELEV
ncbi:hypothetical protein BD779DRAFT_1466441 [Infundibulicybe gibba]|nr:hypothetical protein BD779DRAFT_1466441 [Infundibulicybe gibba]